jgi:hypothetical protein
METPRTVALRCNLHMDFTMRSAGLLIASLAAACSPPVRDPTSVNDMAVLRTVLDRQCTESLDYVVVSDAPADESNPRFPKEWEFSDHYDAEYARQSPRAARWPIGTICSTASVESDERIRASFEKDKRIPPDWEFFRADFKNARALIRLSRPVYSPDGARAAIVMGSSCGLLCGHGFVIELEKSATGWKVARVVGTWMS